VSPGSPALTLAGPQSAGGSGDRIARLRALLRPEFLADAGWDAENGVFAPPRTHPLLGLRKCAVADCEAGVRTSSADLCRVCTGRFKASGLTMEEFTAAPCGKIGRGEQLCRIPGCQRPTYLRVRFCQGHYCQWRETGLPPGQFLAQPGIWPFPSFGPCRVASCLRVSAIREGLCAPHRVRWRSRQRECPGASFTDWLRVAEPVNVDHIVIFKGLAEQVQLELLVALQHRTDAGKRTLVTALRAVVTALRQTEAGSLSELDESVLKQTRHDAATLFRSLRTTVRRCLASPETERLSDVWDLAVFGLGGNLKFTGISQPWLRETAKQWAEDDLPRHRGRKAASAATEVAAAVSVMSASLRLSRPDHGNQPEALSRRDIVALANRLAHRQRSGEISEWMRLRTCRYLRRFLLDIRGLGLTRQDGPAAGLPDDFILSRQDVPPEPGDDGSGRDLPDWVLRIINDYLHVLEERSGAGARRTTELLIDTGRRPDEVCQLPWNCTARDSDGKPVLIYTDSKNNKPGRRLPIAESTAQVIADQQDEVRRRFPATPVSHLVLFPRDLTNPDGTKTSSEACFGQAHRKFIDAIAGHLVTTVAGTNGRQRTEIFDPAAIVPYAYRHSYAQRHADQGVPPDVLRDLMGHDSVRTTLGYYRVTEKRTRAAIDRVSAHQFDGQGRRVFHGIRGLLAHEHARMRVGQVAVPFGTCTEPSNVKAGGQACPYKFTCLGCGHFRSDPSYLPELKSYLQQLLADRERLRAATGLQEWARAQLTPRDEEITQLRELIRRIEADVGDLSEQDQARIAEAITVIRNTRQVVNLGMPATQPPAAQTG